MKFLLFLFAELFLALALVKGSDTEDVKKRTFKVKTRNYDRVNADDPNIGPEILMKAYKKHSIAPPQALVKRSLDSRNIRRRLAKRQSGNVTNPAEYVSPVMIGGQQVLLAFDTGSSDLWVFSNQLRRAETVGHRVYDPQTSQTFKPLPGSSWSIMYGDGSGARGNVGMETVTVGGLAVKNQAVELASRVAASFAEDRNVDGLLGLAFRNLNTVKPDQVKTYFDNLMPLLEKPVFTADLRPGGDGVYEFGRIDDTKYVGQLSKIAVDSSSGFWLFDSKRFQVGDKIFDSPNSKPAIADTGTTLVLVDPRVAQAYYSQVDGAVESEQAGGFVYPCNTKLPDLSLAIGPTYMARIPSNKITFNKVTRDICFGGVQSNMGSSIQIYGDTMFTAQYVVFDGGSDGKPALLMAPKKE